MKSGSERANARSQDIALEDSMTDFYNLIPSAPKGRFDGIERPYTAETVEKLRGFSRGSPDG